MPKRTKAKTYRMVGRINYRGTVIGPGEEIPKGISVVNIKRYIEHGKIREIDPATGLNIEPKNSREIELGHDQIKSFFAKPAGDIARHLNRTEFSVETLTRMQANAEQMSAPQQLRALIDSAIDRRMAAR